MKKHFFNYLFALIVGVVIFSSCKSEKTFEVKGEISAGAGDTLYLEHRGLDGVDIIDSLKIKKDGTFSFKAPAPENPEFYQLRLKDQLAVFAIDSMETLQVKADAENLTNTFTTINSVVNDQIKQIDNKAMNVRQSIFDLAKKHDLKEIDDITYLQLADSLLNEYKGFATQLIIGNPSGAAAYYALFQKVDDYLIFDPMNKKDYSMFGAVATSWDRYYPGTSRSKHLYDFTMNALKTRRQTERQQEFFEKVPVETISEMPDIVLPNVNGQQVSLSSLKGNVVLLDFTVYNAKYTLQQNMKLNSVYSQLANRGFEIYQISLDSDEHVWKNVASNLPWVTVRDPESVYSELLTRYNVRDIPTAFILDRNGNLLTRIENYDNLLNEVSKFL